MASYRVRTQKTGKRIHVPIFEPLQECLDSVGVDGDTFLTSSLGKPFFSPDSFGNWFKIKCKESKLPLEYTAHGLRKAEATIVANAGASPHGTDGKKWKWLS